VFVLSDDELTRLLDGAPDKGWLVNDALGLGIRDGAGASGLPELIAVKYPKKLGIHCLQPTTLDAGWTKPGWYFVSRTNIDSWGLTQSCSGDSACVRERVHSGLTEVPAGFSGFIIGVSDAPLIEDRAKLLEEAYRRIP
jgi:hypothetical protein